MTGIIILAAGSSSRLGQPKQNLVYKGKTLLQRTIETAMASIGDLVIVVLGANEEVIGPTLTGYNVTIIQNPDWSEGMASSIRTGLQSVLQLNQRVNSVILMLCDQPFVDTYIVNMLVAAKTKEGICACEYNDIIGPPVLFDAVYFDELLALTGSEGAKKVIRNHAEKVKRIPFDLAGIDIDTPADYKNLV
ncbi:MAG TPA: nucleotidyltransferase family protein [Mucilaginibacter sp.]|jgi:molybdenum cofactor cytidylyltransferase|nr:nucleotidyltransferase family protein [Mucilaginibacter sp.]